MKNDYILLAFRNLKHRGLRTFLTVLGILIGIAAVVSLFSVGEGLKAAVNAQFNIGSTQVISVQAGGLTAFGPPGTGVIRPLTRDDVEAINNLNSVEIAIARNIETGSLEFNDIVQFGFAATIPDEKKERDYLYEILDLKVIEGDLIESVEKKILIGNDFYYADKGGFNKAIRAGDKVLINGESFEVAGVLEKKGSFIIDGSLLIPDKYLNELKNYGDEVDIIAVIVKNKDLMDKAKEDIEKLLRKRRDVKIGEEDFRVSTPESALGTVNSIITGVQIFILMIAAISIIVGTVGIVNTMMTAVMERKKEIGIMKSIGARNSDIFYQFLIEAGILGMVGGLLGALIGTALGYYGVLAISNFIGSTLEPTINIPLIILALIGSFIIGAISGVLPALRAAKLSPVEALRT